MNANGQTYPQSAVVKTLARPSVITLTVSLFSVSLFILLQTLITAFHSKFSNLEVFYHFTSDAGAAVINMIYGIITAAILLVITLGLFLAYKAASKNNLQRLKKSFDILLYGLGCAVVFEIIYIVIAFASVYVFNYDANTTNYFSGIAFRLFNSTIIIGASILTLTISMIRVILSWSRNLTSDELSNKGMILSTITSIVAACVFAIMFISALYFLVTPSDHSQVQDINVFALITNIFNVLIYTAATVLFITLPIVLGRFNRFVSKYNFVTDNAYIHAGYGNQPHYGYYNRNGMTNISSNYPPNYSYNNLYQQTLTNINQYGSNNSNPPQSAAQPQPSTPPQNPAPTPSSVGNVTVHADVAVAEHEEIKTSYPQPKSNTAAPEDNTAVEETVFPVDETSSADNDTAADSSEE